MSYLKYTNKQMNNQPYDPTEHSLSHVGIHGPAMSSSYGTSEKIAIEPEVEHNDIKKEEKIGKEHQGKEHSKEGSTRNI